MARSTARGRVVLALLIALGFYALSDILLWQRIFEAHGLSVFDPDYQTGHVAVLIGMMAVGAVLLLDSGLWALWFQGRPVRPGVRRRRGHPVLLAGRQTDTRRAAVARPIPADLRPPSVRRRHQPRGARLGRLLGRGVAVAAAGAAPIAG